MVSLSSAACGRSVMAFSLPFAALLVPESSLAHFILKHQHAAPSARSSPRPNPGLSVLAKPRPISPLALIQPHRHPLYVRISRAWDVAIVIPPSGRHEAPVATFWTCPMN